MLVYNLYLAFDQKLVNLVGRLSILTVCPAVIIHVSPGKLQYSATSSRSDCLFALFELTVGALMCLRSLKGVFLVWCLLRCCLIFRFLFYWEICRPQLTMCVHVHVCIIMYVTFLIPCHYNCFTQIIPIVVWLLQKNQIIQVSSKIEHSCDIRTMCWFTDVQNL